MKKTSALIIAILAIAAIVTATATIVIKKPLPHPEPLAPARVMLNEILSNDTSEFEELKGLDKKVEAYMAIRTEVTDEEMKGYLVKIKEVMNTKEKQKHICARAHSQ